MAGPNIVQKMQRMCGTDDRTNKIMVTQKNLVAFNGSSLVEIPHGFKMPLEEKECVLLERVNVFALSRDWSKLPEIKRDDKFIYWGFEKLQILNFAKANFYANYETFFPAKNKVKSKFKVDSIHLKKILETMNNDTSIELAFSECGRLVITNELNQRGLALLKD